ncbi:hypothetical protein Tco_0873859 [Tanacetum coccineum]|uniref:Uncharacterized protein n=1 Tax=Tanacetum coccineum TaxID=301880 RepID=A0ABQ5BNN0_9ASTR
MSLTLFTLLFIFTATTTRTTTSPENLTLTLKSKTSRPYTYPQMVTAIDIVTEKVNELGINERVKVLTAVSLGFVTGSESVAKGLLSSLTEKGVTSLFVSMGNRNVSLGSFKVVCGGFALKRDLSNDVSYVGLDDGEMMDYGVVDVR